MGYIAVIDYGVGNLMSVTNALQYIGRESKITDQASDLERADGIILPGVGAFPDAAEKLQQTGLVATLKEQAAKKPWASAWECSCCSTGAARCARPMVWASSPDRWS